MKIKIRCSLLWVLLLWIAATASAKSVYYQRLQQDVIEERLKQFAGKNPERATTLKKLFEEAGCGGKQLTEQRVPQSDASNIICTLPGSSDKTIIIGAHFDRVPDVDGVADNWSGASLLPSLYQSIRSMPRHYTFIFVGFTDEEKGFVGSRFYADRLADEEVARVRGMITLDTLGLGPTEAWISNSDPELVKQLSKTASSLKLPVTGMNIDDIGDSDGQSFKARKIPILTLHSVTKENLAILHSSMDNFAAIKLDDYYNGYRLIVVFLTILDSEMDPNPSE